MNVFDIGEVMHAWVTKVHPERGQSLWHFPGNPLVPYGRMHERLTLNSPQGLYDATWPVDWSPYTEVPPKMSFKQAYPKEIQEKVVASWAEYGFKGV